APFAQDDGLSLNQWIVCERLAHPILDAETVDQAAAALDASIALIASLALHPVAKAGIEHRLRSDYGGAIETLTGS
ncbi:MAG: hypothetical protein AAFS03_09425, partial [Pseudomonadota bacterium]